MRLFDLITPKLLHDAMVEEPLDTKRLDELKPLIRAADRIITLGQRFLTPRDTMIILLDAVDHAIEQATKGQT